MRVKIEKEIALPTLTNEGPGEGCCLIQDSKDFDCNGILCQNCIFQKSNYEAMQRS